MSENSPLPIIRSKLFRPPIPRDIVTRSRLLKELSPGTLTLVSAPAGYGKSTLVSQWLDQPRVQSAWVSLEPADSDVRQFLMYVTAAIRTRYPDSCADTVECLGLSTLPTVEALAATLDNDLDKLGGPFTLVLDDYHQLNHTGVHELLDRLLRHRSRVLGLIIVTRRDPPLALTTYRARGTLVEIRMQELAFSDEEAGVFIRNHLGEEVSADTRERMYKVTEGWPAAMRLAVLAAPDPASMAAFVRHLSGDVRVVRDYLLQEVLDKQTPAIRKLLLLSSCLDRFNASICDALVAGGNFGTTNADRQMDGKAYLEYIEDTGLFGIALDGASKWFRFHHLFRTMLHAQAIAELGEDVVREIYLVASRWFETNGDLEEAIQYVLEAGSPSGAKDLIVRHRNEIMNFEQWFRLESWLRVLPSELIEESPEMLILKARLLQTRGEAEEAWRLLDKVEVLLRTPSIDEAKALELTGSIESLRCYQHYSNSNGELAVESARSALRLLPENCFAERGFAMILLGAGLQMTGELELAKQAVYDALAGDAVAADPSGTYRSRLLMSLCFIQWMSADLPGLKRTSGELARQGSALGETEILRCFFQGAVDYQNNDLESALVAAKQGLTHKTVANADFLAQCAYIAALCFEGLNRPDEATDMGQFALEFALKHDNKPMVLRSEAFLAELSIRQGRLSEAIEWGRHYKPGPLTPMYRFYSPTMTLAKSLVMADTQQSRHRAEQVLNESVEHLQRVHNKLFLIQALSLRAMLHESMGDIEAAIDDLTKAVTEALPGRGIRVFVDLGPRLSNLMNRIDLDPETLVYVGEILAARRNESSLALTVAPHGAILRTAKQPMLDPLSTREQEVLVLLAERLSNKEIADRLHISVVTVKRHAANIYQKLAVNDRRQAVAKALGLGLLQQAG